MDIAHYHYHKHGAYLIEHSDLAGFSREDQQMLALLVRGHRRNIPKDKFAEFGDEGVQLIRLCVLLRFAILFHHIRGTQQMPKVELKAGEDNLEVVFRRAGWKKPADPGRLRQRGAVAGPGQLHPQRTLRTGLLRRSSRAAWALRGFWLPVGVLRT